jgi:quinol monooxygenase YgiN
MMSDEKQAIHVIAEAIAKPGQEEALYRTLHACVAPTHAEPGNRGYILHQDLDNPARFFLYETWVSRQALNEHFTTPHCVGAWPQLAAVEDLHGVGGDARLHFLAHQAGSVPLP